MCPEPFGRIGVEAGARGLPAAAFAVGGIPEWLIEGVNGHLRPASSAALANAIVKCLHDGDHYARLREGAREVASRFRLDTHIEQLIELFNHVARA